MTNTSSQLAQKYQDGAQAPVMLIHSDSRGQRSWKISTNESILEVDLPALVVTVDQR